MNTLIPTKRKSSGLESWPSLSTWMDDVLGKGLGSEFMSNFNTGITLPAVNVKDTPEAFVVEMAVPGLSKSDFDINIDNQVLSVSAEVKTENKEENETYTRKEFGYSSFKRSFALPNTVEANKISANYEDGILKIDLPKRDEAKQKPKRNITVS
ncbi:Hsp20/alpha crystallin family protein [Mangrovimonas aestuarii]|uniref:Hsp20/alpha crystallin family protein n=1 Tax=Mangrovimonas aestuarii TaxID=3018443 RepID=UPI002378DDF9|nr:Hsp20/alpha crystallin family protein [Mangrovimonas aestuarii]